MTETKPKRRRFRFSLLTFLIAVTFIGGWAIKRGAIKRDWSNLRLLVRRSPLAVEYRLGKAGAGHESAGRRV